MLLVNPVNPVNIAVLKARKAQGLCLRPKQKFAADFETL